MAGFHHLGDPYFPKQGNTGWIVEELEEDPEEIPEHESEEEIEEEVDEEKDDEEEDDDSDAESEFIYPPYMTRVPAHRWGYNGPRTLGL